MCNFISEVHALQRNNFQSFWCDSYRIGRMKMQILYLLLYEVDPDNMFKIMNVIHQRYKKVNMSLTQ